MKKIFYSPLFAVFFALLLLTSCREEGGVEVKGLSGVTVTGFHDGVLTMKIGLLISNRTKHKVVVRGLKATVRYGEEEAGKITVTEKIRILAETEAVYRVPLEMELQNLGNLGRAVFQSAVNGRKKELHLQGVLRIRSGMMYKKISFDEKAGS